MTFQDALRYARNPTIRAWIEVYSRQHMRESHADKHTERLAKEILDLLIARQTCRPAACHLLTILADVAAAQVVQMVSELPEIAKLLAQVSDGRN